MSLWVRLIFILMTPGGELITHSDLSHTSLLTEVFTLVLAITSPFVLSAPLFFVFCSPPHLSPSLTLSTQADLGLSRVAICAARLRSLLGAQAIFLASSSRVSFMCLNL